jgi:hypothetical protein
MNGIGKHAACYRGFLPDDRCLVPLTVLLWATVALWLLVYLVAAWSRPNKKRALGASPRPSGWEFAHAALFRQSRSFDPNPIGDVVS